MNSRCALKSNELGTLLETRLVNALDRFDWAYWRLHTVRSFRGVSNPCDFVVLGTTFTALLECKATNKDRFSCAGFQQLRHFEKAASHPHVGEYGLLLYFHSSCPKYVYASDERVINNKLKHRPINPMDESSFDLMSDNLTELVSRFEKEAR